MSQLIDKRCPVCRCYIKLHTGDVHGCISCPFACFEEDFDRVCKAMKNYDSARKIAEWVLERHRHTNACLDHDSLLFHCTCGYDFKPNNDAAYKRKRDSICTWREDSRKLRMKQILDYCESPMPEYGRPITSKTRPNAATSPRFAAFRTRFKE